MNAARLFSAIAGAAARRPRLVVAVAIVLGLAGAGLALRLKPTAATSTFVSSSSAEYKSTQSFYENFGEEPVEVLVKGDLQQLVLSEDINRLVGLEGCLSGNVPAKALAGEGGADGPCGQLSHGHPVKVVFGPGTFINEAANQIDEQLASQSKQAETQAKQAERVVVKAALARGLPAAEAHALGAQASKITMARFQEGLVTLALQFGLTSKPSLDNHDFVTSLVFDSTKRAGTPKQRFAYLFPSREDALISVRMRAGLSESQRTRTIELVRRAIAMPQWKLKHGERYLVTGVPVIVSDLTKSITHSIELLLIAVLLVMAAALGLIFTGRPRLLPLAIAVLAAALTFGALSLAGASLTVAAIAVLPVLVGLAVDYAIQFQSRVQEESERGDAAPEAIVARAATLGAPTIATAGAASAAAMLVLLLSPVPMVRGFGLLLVLGVVIAFVCALSAGAAVLTLAGRADRARARRRAGAGAAAPAGPRLRSPRLAQDAAAAWREAGELLRENPLTRAVSRVALVGAVQRPGRVLIVGLALAALGWGLDTQTRVETDITKLVPQNLSSLEGLNALERTTGVGGEIDLMVSSRALTRPATIEWMSRYEQGVLKRFGYSSARGCGKARLCPAFSLPDLFSTQAATAGQIVPEGAAASGAAGKSGKAAKPGKAGKAGAPAKPAKLTQAQVNGLLGAIPPYFSQDVITPDRHVATLAFGIRVMSLQQQQQLIEGMRASLHPPAGVSAQLVGLPVLAAKSGTQVASPWRRVETLLASLAVVALILLLAFRGERRRALVPLVPIALASGWSALILFLVRVPLNPMSVTLGALVIAISTEFSVLLSERYRQELLAGLAPIEALRRAYSRTGAAVAASGVTAIAGFAVLALSDIRMLRDFGLVTLIDLSVSLLGVLVALPAALLRFGAGPSGGGVEGEGAEPVALRPRADEPVHEPV
ncbi:MAG TPA: MMPL family transporter [Solirubrobacteraceae bacterium]|nr:MMPL family transporter [Solirubrobacteraceae bacterium]